MLNTQVVVFRITAKQEALKENITFRLDKDTLNNLRFDAEARNASVNSIAQSIFTTHYKWTAGAPNAGMIPIHKSLLFMLLDKVEPNDVNGIAKLFAEVRIKDMMLALRNNFALQSFLDVLESWMSVSSVMFNKRMVDGLCNYNISHELGSKWSSFFSLMLQTVFLKMGVVDVAFEVTDNTVMFSIPLTKLRQK